MYKHLCSYVSYSQNLVAKTLINLFHPLLYAKSRKSSAKQKHLGCKTSEAKLEALVISYSNIHLKGVIFGGGPGLSCLASSGITSL